MSHTLLYIIKEVHLRNIRFRAERKYICEIANYKKNLVLLSSIHLSVRFLAAFSIGGNNSSPANERLAGEQQLI